jgi:(p)ppGpp synthase/HD superfamily hydrolase
MVYESTYEHLAERLLPHLNREELARVQHAYEVAEAAHRGQMRDEGTPYIVHPVRVALTLANELEIYAPRLICSALLHDVIEDSPTTRTEIAAMFDEEVAEIVWLLTKFDDVLLADYLATIEAAAATGASLVKLCDRLDNLRFLHHSPRLEKKRRTLFTTQKYYLPLAARTNRYLYNEMQRSFDELRQQVPGFE